LAVWLRPGPGNNYGESSGDIHDKFCQG
jgi:hypothetical protein